MKVDDVSTIEHLPVDHENQSEWQQHHQQRKDNEDTLPYLESFSDQVCFVSLHLPVAMCTVTEADQSLTETSAFSDEN